MRRHHVRAVVRLLAAGAEFIVVGAHALAAHGVVRATGDLDIWVRPTPANAARVWAALTRFGAPLQQLDRADLCEAELVFQIGVSPQRIDLLTSISGIEFEEAWTDRLLIRIGELEVPVLSRTGSSGTSRPLGVPAIWPTSRSSRRGANRARSSSYRRPPEAADNSAGFGT